jgi:hypothetical protein
LSVLGTRGDDGQHVAADTTAGREIPCGPMTFTIRASYGACGNGHLNVGDRRPRRLAALFGTGPVEVHRRRGGEGYPRCAPGILASSAGDDAATRLKVAATRASEPASVAHAETPGTTLAITTNLPHPSNWFGAQANPVLPSDVADSIRTARANGWTPESPGSPFHLDQSEGFVSSR